MRFFRPLSVGAAALAVAAGLTGPAIAQTPSGVGTSLSSTKVLTAQLGANGSLLDLALLTDSASASLDSTPGSASKLSLGSVSSSIVALDAVNKQLPSFEAKHTGPTSQDLSAGALGLAAPVLQGSVSGGKVFATMADGVATSGLNVEVVNLSDAVGGLIHVGSAKSNLGATAAGDNSNAGRSVAVNDIKVLDLGAVLQGLGIQLGSLTVDQVTGLVDSLNAQAGLGLPSGQTTLTGTVAALNAAIDDLQASVDGVTSTDAVTDVTTAIDDTTSSLLDSADIASPLPTTSTATVDDAVVLVNDAIDALQAELVDLIENGVKALDDIALLRLEGVEVGVNTKAVADTAGSTAEVVGKIGKVSVGNIAVVSELDLAAAADKISASVASVNAAVSKALGSVHPDLGNLVNVAVLEKTTDVAVKDGYTTATAGVTALSATVTPPATLAAIVDAVNALVADLEVADVLGVSVDQVTTELGLSTTMNSLASTLSLGFGALTQPATVKVAQVLSASNYRVGAASAPGAPASAPTLPRTGGDTLLLAAAVAVILGLAARRFLLPAEPKAVRIEK